MQDTTGSADADGEMDGPRLFISYRRDDAPGHAGRLYDELSRRFGESQVFMDLNMEPGVDFVEQINDAVGSCSLLIAVIGPHWTTAQDAHGDLRLDDPADFVRAEVQAALSRRGVRVIPALVEGARMPNAGELPPSLADLVRRNALELSDARWSTDVERLVSTVEAVLEHPAPDRGVQPIRRRPRPRPALLGAVLAALAGAGAVAFANGDDGRGGQPTPPAPRTNTAPAPGPTTPSTAAPPGRADLLRVVPDAVRAGCKRARGTDFWMGSGHHAERQEICALAPGLLTHGVDAAQVTYGLFADGARARDFVEGDYSYELRARHKQPKRCGRPQIARLEQEHPAGGARCYRNREGVFVNWAVAGSPVAAQLTLGTSATFEQALDQWAKLL
ncbi:MAG: hypothetical protein QOE31_2296 [Solirubrobacteraceae bacterium]|nr:hypothetical protein [Solirubrobacteraceae bacterium]